MSCGVRRSALAHSHAGPSVDIAITLAKASRGDEESITALKAMRVDLGAWLDQPGVWMDHRHSALTAFAGSIDSGLRGGDWNWAIGVALHQNSTTQQFLDPVLGGVIGGMAGVVTRAAPWRRVIFRNERAAANGGDDWTRADYVAAGRFRAGLKLNGAEKRKLKEFFERRGFVVTYDDELVKKLAMPGQAPPVAAFVTGSTQKFRGKPMLGAFRFPKVVTWYEVWHEMAHYVHYRKLGPTEYRRGSLTTIEKEQFVFDLLRDERRWNRIHRNGGAFINRSEKLHAIDYIQRLGGRSDPKQR